MRWEYEYCNVCARCHIIPSARKVCLCSRSSTFISHFLALSSGHTRSQAQSSLLLRVPMECELGVLGDTAC